MAIQNPVFHVKAKPDLLTYNQSAGLKRTIGKDALGLDANGPIVDLPQLSRLYPYTRLSLETNSNLYFASQQMLAGMVSDENFT